MSRLAELKEAQTKGSAAMGLEAGPTASWPSTRERQPRRWELRPWEVRGELGVAMDGQRERAAGAVRYRPSWASSKPSPSSWRPGGRSAMGRELGEGDGVQWVRGIERCNSSEVASNRACVKAEASDGKASLSRALYGHEIQKKNVG
jgi:hypothetical protein